MVMMNVNLNTNSNKISSKNDARLSSSASKDFVNNNDNLIKTSDKRTLIQKKDDSKFKDVLDSKANSKIEKTQLKSSDTEKDKINDVVNDTDLQDKIEELKEEIKKLPKDDVTQMLNNILNLLAKANQDDLNVVNNESLNSDVLNSVVEGLKQNSNGNNELADLINKMLENTKQDSLSDVLNKDTKNLVQDLLNQLGANIGKDTETKTSTNKVKDLISQISDIIGKTEGKEEKVVNFQSLFKDFSQSKDDGLSKQTSKDTLTDTTKNTSAVSKEDDFLNSLVDDSKKDSNLSKINLFASRNVDVRGEAVSPTEQVSVNKATIGDDLIKNIKFMTTNAMKELTVKITPRELGELTISLVQENGIMKASVKANSKETYELLSQNLVEMKKALGEQNIKIADVNIELYQDDTTFFKDQGFNRELSQEQGKNKQNNETSNVNPIEIDDEKTEAINDSNVDFLA
ncbi:flagellar hook-length control protein FliK [Clostridium uliginosum]|uniref:Flagellar hook-length control protein FliK n=1 Tax=Clostridium uliginosum TaxID=119641 RepID=A0A1I1KKB1_9CLOT|nr:flagellar hook-length control protein FliK [Clostridium uliginosum]SFC61237.1 flagellar hook-length control protein FliK [Clostridium uliginosum]